MEVEVGILVKKWVEKVPGITSDDEIVLCYYPRQESNLQSPDPESDALSIRPLGQIVLGIGQFIAPVLCGFQGRRPGATGPRRAEDNQRPTVRGRPLRRVPPRMRIRVFGKRLQPTPPKARKGARTAAAISIRGREQTARVVSV